MNTDNATTKPDGGASVSTAMLERAVDTFIAFADKTTYLRHPDVPYHGTEKGDSEELWRRRLISAALAPIIAAEREACAKICDDYEAATDRQGCDDLERQGYGARECANLIRMRSNCNVTGAEPVGGASGGRRS